MGLLFWLSCKVNFCIIGRRTLKSGQDRKPSQQGNKQIQNTRALSWTTQSIGRFWCSKVHGIRPFEFFKHTFCVQEWKLILSKPKVNSCYTKWKVNMAFAWNIHEDEQNCATWRETIKRSIHVQLQISCLVVDGYYSLCSSRSIEQKVPLHHISYSRHVE